MDSKILGIITARIRSTRLPGKVLKLLAGKSAFAHHVERLRAVRGVAGVFLATSDEPENRPLIEEAERLGVGWHAGAREDVVDRHIRLLEQEGATAALRVTCDAPLFCIDTATRLVERFQGKDYLYVGNMIDSQGTTTEVLSLSALVETHRHYRGPAIAQYVREHLVQFRTEAVEMDRDLCRPEYRLSLDWPEDLALLEIVFEQLYRGAPIPLRSVYAWLDDHPELAKQNAHLQTKDVTRYSDTLAHRPLYGVYRSGDGVVILDEHYRALTYEEFVARLRALLERDGEGARRS